MQSHTQQGEKTFTEEQLISFGYYLLSKQREETLVHIENKDKVTHADVQNWKYLESKKDGNTVKST